MLELNNDHYLSLLVYKRHMLAWFNIISLMREINFTKHALREESKRIRSEITPSECRQSSKKICGHIENWESFRAAETVLTYLPMRNEVDLTPLFGTNQRKIWVIPCIQPGGLMTFHEYDRKTLVRHALGMLEPDPESPATSPDGIDCVLVPGLAYDLSGWRLGYGGGYYDRFLSGFKGVSVGITYNALLFDEVPYDEHDIPVQFIGTEQGITLATNWCNRTHS
jgi:5-formyltetrahydrofolate cyclo-ligase